MSLDEQRYDMRTQDGTSKQSLTVASTASRLRRGGSRSRRMIFTKESHPEYLIKADEDQKMLKSIMERKKAAKSSRNIISQSHMLKTVSNFRMRKRLINNQAIFHDDG